jgi:hypothetical protein
MNYVDSFFRACRSWGSRRIDNQNGKLISDLRQLLTIEGVSGNARDDREELVLDKRLNIIYNDYK